MTPTRTRPTAKPARFYLIDAGTPCQVRRAGVGDWQDHRTKLTRIYAQYVWASDDHYHFVLDGWVMRVERHRVAEVGSEIGADA